MGGPINGRKRQKMILRRGELVPYDTSCIQRKKLFMWLKGFRIGIGVRGRWDLRFGHRTPF